MTSYEKRQWRLVTREQLEASRAAWDAGRFSSEWKPWRHLAAMEAGIIVPPQGDAFDSWDADQPSERAQLVRAMRETPAALEAAIRAPHVHSWAAVVAQLVRRRERVTAELDEAERDVRWDRSHEPTREQATTALRSILATIGGPR